MIGELIPTRVTFGVGRNSINTMFSGTAEFNDIILDSGANFSGGTGGGIILSGGTDLYNIFTTTSGSTTADNGLNIVEGKVSLGGSLTGDTIILTSGSMLSIDNATSGSFYMSGDSTTTSQINLESTLFANQPAGLNVGGGIAKLISTSASTTATVSVTSGGIRIARTYTGGSQAIAIGGSNYKFYIEDSINQKGIQYISNYHANYTARSIPDAGWVANYTASAATNYWSAGTGANSIQHVNTVSSNLASGRASISIGQQNISAANYSATIGGKENDITSTAKGSSIIGSSASTMIANSTYSSIIAGINNSIDKSNYSAIIAGSGCTLGSNSNYSIMIGGQDNSSNPSIERSVILGGSGLVASASDTVYMDMAYIDSFVDLNPQTTLPSPSIGRMFFSGAPLNRMMYNSGGTSLDWIIL